MLWGTTGTAQAFAPPGATPLTVGAMRLALGGTAMLVAALGRGKMTNVLSLPPAPLLLSALCMAAYQPFFFSAVRITGVAVGTLVGIGSAPIFAGLLSLLFLKEKPAPYWYPATALALFGCFLLIAPGGNTTVSAAGIFMALMAGLSFTGYVMISKKLLARHQPDLVLAVVFSLGALFLAPLLFIYRPTWLLEPAGYLAALHLGLLATALAYLLFISGLTVLPASTAVTISLAEPLTAALLGIIVLGEQLSLTSMGGAVLLFFALFLVSRSVGP